MAADDKIQWMIEIDGGEKAVKTIDAVADAAKDIDLSNKTIGKLDMMMRSLLETHHMAKQVAEATRMEGVAREKNLRLAKEQERAEKQRSEDAAKQRQAERADAIGGLRNIAIGGALGGVAMLTSSARAGFQDTLQGQQAQVYGQLLNRQVAAIFAPLLEEKTKYVSQMTQWLQGLQEPQRESIRQMTVFATSMGTLGFLLPRVTKGIAAAMSVGSFSSGAAGAAGGLSSVIGAAGMAGPIGLALAGITSLLASSEEGRAVLVDLVKSFAPVVQALTPAAKALTDSVRELAPAMKSVAEALVPVATKLSELIVWLNENKPTTSGAQMGFNLGQWLQGHPVTPFPAGGSATPGSSSGGLSPVPKGFEDIGRDYERIFEASTKIDLAQQTAANTAATAQAAQTMVGYLATMAGQVASTGFQQGVLAVIGN